MTLLAAAMAGVLAAVILALARAFLGPTVYDRILAINSVGTKTVLVVALLGFLTGRPQFLDIGLFYALVNFVGTVAVLRLSHAQGVEGLREEGELR